MTNEIKTITGEVMDKTESSIQVKKLWIKFFDLGLLTNVKKNDNVEVTYQDNFKNGKTYHNAKSVKVINQVSAAKLTNVNSNSISNSTINTLIMTIKEIYIERKDKPLSDITTDVIASYKQIVDNISK